MVSTCKRRIPASNPAADYDETALMIATERNSAEVVRELLQLGADVNARSHRSSTALDFAARFARSADVITVLLGAGADKRAKNDGGFTPYDTAVKYRNAGLPAWPQAVLNLLKP
jgi:ankyrin repeat protein